MKVDLSGAIRVRLDEALAEARTLEAQGHAKNAAGAYLKAAGLMNSYADYALTRSDQARRRQKARQYLDRAEQLRAAPDRPVPARPDTGTSRAAGVQPPAGNAQHESQGDDSEQYGQDIASLIHRSKVTWSQIGGLDETKRDIKFTYGLALAEKPEGMRLAGWRRMLFYGPPGTGKTLLAAATSNGLGATFFNVRVSSLLSKYFGESSKLVSALFDAARSEADEGFAVVFIDEIDAIAQKRGDASESGAERRMLSTLLSELDGLADKGEDRFVLTIAATNAPWDLDDAILSRFQKRIYIPLPDDAARRSILEILLLKEGHRLECSLDDIVRRTALYSGRDLERLANQAVNIMVEELNGEIPKQVDRGREAIQKYTVNVRPLKLTDFDRALQSIRVDTGRYRELEVEFRKFAANN